MLSCDGRVTELPRSLRRLPADVARSIARQRRRCSQCSAPPTYHARDGRPLAPEGSVGTPFRVAAARKVAAALRNELAEALCGARAGCAALDGALNASSWAPDSFWGALLGDPRALLNATWAPLDAGAPPDTLDAEMATAADRALDAETAADARLWAEPWLFCRAPGPRCEEVCEAATGRCEQRCAASDELRCFGTVDRARWLDPATRFAATAQRFAATAQRFAGPASAFVAVQQDSLVQEVNLCDLDSAFDTLCRGIAAARSSVFEANNVHLDDGRGRYRRPAAHAEQ